MPGALASASLRLLVEFCSSLVSTAMALKAERCRRLMPVGNDYDFIQFFHLRSDGDILFYALAVDKPDLLFNCFIADGGYD